MVMYATAAKRALRQHWFELAAIIAAGYLAAVAAIVVPLVWFANRRERFAAERESREAIRRHVDALNVVDMDDFERRLSIVTDVDPRHPSTEGDAS